MAIVLVALRKESVDRNMTVNGKHVPGREIGRAHV